jgi:hypothetical protein
MPITSRLITAAEWEEIEQKHAKACWGETGKPPRRVQMENTVTVTVDADIDEAAARSSSSTSSAYPTRPSTSSATPASSPAERATQREPPSPADVRCRPRDAAPPDPMLHGCCTRAPNRAPRTRTRSERKPALTWAFTWWSGPASIR